MDQPGDRKGRDNNRIQTMSGVLDQTFQRKTMTDQQGPTGVLDYAFQLNVRTMTEVLDRTYQFALMVLGLTFQLNTNKNVSRVLSNPLKKKKLITCAALPGVMI